MKNQVIAIDQSTSATKAMLFSAEGKMLKRVNVAHAQIYPRKGWVEHDAMEIYANTLSAIRELLADREADGTNYSLAITNQRETVVVWDKETGLPVYNAVVWQCMRGEEICRNLRDAGQEETVRSRAGLLIDPFFSASGVKWILDNVEGAREKADAGTLAMGTIETWLIWKLTAGRSFVTDYTNASRTMLFNIHTMDWDDELLALFGVNRSMLARPLPCDSIFGVTTLDGLFDTPVVIAGAIGDSHGALVGQTCFEAGLGKATYGTGSSVMVNIGENAAPAPEGLVTSVGFAALGKVFYAFEGNIHCTGATLKWLQDKLQLIASPAETEELATSLPSNEGVYLVPAFAGLGAPWWNPNARAAVFGMTLDTGKAHVARAGLESIAYQITDLVSAMTERAGISVKGLRVDGGPTRNNFLMQFQADCLDVPVDISDIEEASAYGAFIMNRYALGLWKTFGEAAATRKSRAVKQPDSSVRHSMEQWREGWRHAIDKLM